MHRSAEDFQKGLLARDFRMGFCVQEFNQVAFPNGKNRTDAVFIKKWLLLKGALLPIHELHCQVSSSFFTGKRSEAPLVLFHGAPVAKDARVPIASWKNCE